MAITTTYNGVTYRSRLEARWAAFFWRIGWTATYEPFDGAGYIPDFLIHGQRPLLVEIKPAVTESEYRAPLLKLVNGLAGCWSHDIAVVGVDPLPPLLETRLWPRFPAGGLLGQPVASNDWTFALGHWITCRVCRQPALFHSTDDFTATPCGHHEGDGHLDAPNTTAIKAAWDAATNDVRWSGRAA